jgi:hypothetical protein
MGHLVCSSPSLHWYELLDAIDAPGFAATRVHVGMDVARTYRVDADAFRGTFLRQSSNR